MARAFRPTEVLFALTGACNLRCAHCDVPRTSARLSRPAAERFIDGCRAAGIRRVGFTGGEPFLAPELLTALVRKSVARGLHFDRIMTNGVWWRTRAELQRLLGRLAAAGYDGSIAVSVDAFHRQDLRKAAAFLQTAAAVWRRPDMCSIAVVRGARDAQTLRVVRRLARLLDGRLIGARGAHPAIRTREGLFARLMPIALSPVGEARGLCDPWDGRWFIEDHCSGPGNVLYVLPDGMVKPCCGYATGHTALTIGNIRRDVPRAIVKRSRENLFVSTVFASGLSRIRRRLIRLGVRFPGRTSNHCFFCDHILTHIPEEVLVRCLDGRRRGRA